MPVKQNAQGAAEALALKEKQRYVQGYLQVISNLYGRKHFSQEQARIAERAWLQKLPPSSFVNLIRKSDPAYPRTSDFRIRHSEAKEAWQKYRPNRPMDNDFFTNYVHSNLSKTQMLSRLEYGMKKNPIMPPSVNANAYRTMRSLLNDSFVRTTGKEAHPLLHDLIFSAKMKDQDIDLKFPDLFGGKDNFRWMDPAKAGKQEFALPGLDARSGNG